MTRVQVLFAGLLIALSIQISGCADGGVGGTGISGGGSATVQGNIQDISTNGDATPPAAGVSAAFSGVWVGVQGTDVSDVTDADGNFVLVGPIAGDRVVEFREHGSSQSSTLNVTVLGGAVTTLKDVRISLSTLRALADEVRVTNVELALDEDAQCSGNSGMMSAHLTAQGDFELTVLITPDTEILRVSDSSSTPIACSDLIAGSEANVRGVLTGPREIRATGINRTKSGRPRRRPPG